MRVSATWSHESERRERKREDLGRRGRGIKGALRFKRAPKSRLLSTRHEANRRNKWMEGEN